MHKPKFLDFFSRNVLARKLKWLTEEHLRRKDIWEKRKGKRGWLKNIRVSFGKNSSANNRSLNTCARQRTFLMITVGSFIERDKQLEREG